VLVHPAAAHIQRPFRPRSTRESGIEKGAAMMFRARLPDAVGPWA
jgi:hypothetical protein